MNAPQAVNQPVNTHNIAIMAPANTATDATDVSDELVNPSVDDAFWNDTSTAADLSNDIIGLTIMGAPPKQTTLAELPNEVLRNIIFHLEPSDSLNSVQLVSRQFYTLSQEPLLWRYYCKTQFKYWDEKHDIRRRFNAEAEETEWRALYLDRKNTDERTTSLLDSILSQQTKRITQANMIVEFGYDAKDTLLRHRNCDPNAPDVLARRFHSNAILDHIQRAEVLKEWQKLAMQQVGRHSDITPERALACFDMFVLHEHSGDLDEVSSMVDELKKQFEEAYPDFRHSDLRQKAITVARFLRNRNLTGLDDEERFTDFQNNYISAALQDPQHPSTPLISTAIYCSLACRLGLDASFLNFPGHVHAAVTIEDDEQIYMDPYKSAEEVPRSRLIWIMNEVGIAPEHHHGALSPTNLQTVVTRNAQNLLNSCKESDIQEHDFFYKRGKGLSNPVADANDAVYSALWAIFMMSSMPLAARTAIPHIMNKYGQDYPMDGTLIEKFICERPGYAGEELETLIRQTVGVTLRSDSVAKTPKRRDGSGFRDNVRYQVGQVFRHKRERYTAVICGWDEQCKMENGWIRQQGVDRLPRGRSQSFYHSLYANPERLWNRRLIGNRVHDSSSRYVAEENIEILEPDEAPEALLSLAGKYFKRWDRETHRFVSNVDDEYPDN